MNYKCLIIFFVGLAPAIACVAQNIKLKKKCTLSIETQGDVSFVNGNSQGVFVLRDVKISCDKLAIGKDVKRIKIIGDVTITCNSIENNMQDGVIVLFSRTIRLGSNPNILRFSPMPSNIDETNFRVQSNSNVQLQFNQP